MLSSLKQYYGSSFIFTAIAAVLGFLLGGWAGMGIVLILGVMETSLSFDNAVVNASVLKNWNAEWRHRFLTWGMPVAVFGMRLVFPLLIVSIISALNPVEAVLLAFKNPGQYSTILASAHTQIAAFGGAYLMMIALKFFIDAEKDTHWLSWIESPLAKIGKLDTIQVAITSVIIMLTATHFLDLHDQVKFLVAAFSGVAAYIAADAAGSLVGGEEEGVVGNFVKQGVAGLLYLELLDASFSFDGVMGSFALSNNIVVIGLGLGTGAMFVRSMTLQLVDKGVLNEFKFLEHGAFYSIATLAILMYVGAFVQIPEVVTGLIGAGFIVFALLSSILYNRKHANDPVEA